MPIPDVLSNTLVEGTTGVYTFALVDQDAAAIDPGFLDSLTLTIYDRDSHAIVNNRDHQDILNANNGTVTTETSPSVRTIVTFTLQPEDTVILDQTRLGEQRILHFRWSWNNGTWWAAHVVQFGVENVELEPVVAPEP
jgi:hypothetical protein